MAAIGERLRLSGAKLRRSAAEAGIGPDEPLAPTIEALAETTDLLSELPKEFGQILDQARQVFRPDDIRQAVYQGVSYWGARAVTRIAWRNAIAGASLLAAALLIGVGGGILVTRCCACPGRRPCRGGAVR